MSKLAEEATARLETLRMVALGGGTITEARDALGFSHNNSVNRFLRRHGQIELLTKLNERQAEVDNAWKKDRIEDLLFMDSWGVGAEEAARRLGISTVTLYDFCSKAGVLWLHTRLYHHGHNCYPGMGCPEMIPNVPEEYAA